MDAWEHFICAHDKRLKRTNKTAKQFTWIWKQLKLCKLLWALFIFFFASIQHAGERAMKTFYPLPFLAAVGRKKIQLKWNKYADTAHVCIPLSRKCPQMTGLKLLPNRKSGNQSHALSWHTHSSML
jgi:hypothetical protein